MTVDNAPPKAGRREWIALAVLALPTLLVTVDMNVLFLALPHITADLQAGPIEQLWITDIYAFVIAGFTVTMGNLGDRYGHRRILTGAAVLFIVASLLCAFAPSVTMLIAARALLGFAGAALVPLTLALIITMFQDPRQMGAALGVWASALSGGVVLGPPLGGIVLNSFWWGSAFLIGVPVMVILLVATPLLPGSRNPDGAPIDLVSVGLFLVAILPVVAALKDVARDGVSAWPIVLLVVGIIGITLFIRRQNRIPNPLLDLKLFKNKVIGAGILVFVTSGMLAGALGLVTALYLQLVEGLSVLEAGLWILPPSLALIVFSNVAPKIANRVRPAAVIAGGMAIAAVGSVVLTQIDAAGGLALVVVGLGICLIGTSPVGPVANQAVMMTAPPERAGAVGGLTSTSGELGAALGVAVLGSVATAVYRGDVTLPAGTPADVAEPAGDSISGAVAAAENLPPGEREALLGAANEAFTSGVNVVAVIAAVGFAIIAVVAWRGMRSVPPSGAPGPEAETPTEAPPGVADEEPMPDRTTV